MLPEVFVFVICLWLPRVANGDSGRGLTETIHLSKFKVNVKANCRALEEAGSSFRHWILPSLAVIGGNTSENDHRHIVVSPGNFSLGIWRITDDQLGDYLCSAVDSNGHPLYSRTSIFIYVAPVWVTYRLNFIMALSASGVFVVIATIFCAVSSLRWRGTAPDPGGDYPLPVKSNGSGSEGPRRDFELSAEPKVMTSGVMTRDEVSTVNVAPALDKGKPVTEVEDDTAM